MRPLLPVLILFLAGPALAEEPAPPAAPKLAPSMNIGAFGLVSSEGWVGQYVYFGPSVLIPLSDTLSFIPVLTLEVAPGIGNWGFTFSPVLEFLPPNSPVAIDLMPSIIQDTAPGGGTVAIWAVGPCANILLPDGVTLAPGFQVAGIVGVPEAGITVNPMINLGLLIL